RLIQPLPRPLDGDPLLRVPAEEHPDVARPGAARAAAGARPRPRARGAELPGNRATFDRRGPLAEPRRAARAGGGAARDRRVSRCESVASIAVLAGAGVLALALPGVLARWRLSPDAIEYLAIANAAAHGHGFRDPILYSFYLGDGVAPPAPAWAVRAPA